MEYNRPGFPGDGYGFSTDDRMTYGSYAVDYLSNWAGPRYLGELVDRSGDKLFKDGEVSHMADVKLVILSAFGAGVLLILLSLIAMIYLRRRSTGGVRRGLFAGSIVTLVIIIGLGVLAVLGWEQFFTEFHRVFFANGTWTFSLQDTLIRLFPGQFWVDAGIVDRRPGAARLPGDPDPHLADAQAPRRAENGSGRNRGRRRCRRRLRADAAADNTTQHTDAEPAAKRSLFKRGKNRNAGDGAEDQPADADTGSAPAPADGQASRGHSSSV